MTHEFFLASFLLLKKYFNNYKMDKTVEDLYFNSLKNYPDEKIKLACQNIIANFKPTSTTPFPLIADILNYCGEGMQGKAINIIGLIRKAIQRHGRYTSVSFNDLVLHGVIERFGGWVELCDWTQDNWNINEKRITDAYQAAKNAGINGNSYLVGLHELNNTANGYLNFIKPPTMIMQGQNGQIQSQQMLSFPEKPKANTQLEYVNELALLIGKKID